MNTFIVGNKICGGRCEGIFLIETGEVWIKKNEIYDNYDGIVVLCAVPLIQENQIYSNKNTGIYLRRHFTWHELAARHH